MINKGSDSSDFPRSRLHRDSTPWDELRANMAIPAVLRSEHVFDRGRFLAPIFIFGHKSNPRRLVTYGPRRTTPGRDLYVASQLAEGYRQSHIPIPDAPEALQYTLVLDTTIANSQAEKYQMAALVALMECTRSGVESPRSGPAGVGADLKLIRDFDHPRDRTTQMHEYRRQDDPRGPGALVMFNLTEPMVCFTAGLIGSHQNADKIAAGMQFDEVPPAIREPVLVSMLRSEGQNRTLPIEALTSSIAQVSFIKAVWKQNQT